MIIWLLLKLYNGTLWRHITLSDPNLAYLTTKSIRYLANIVFHSVSLKENIAHVCNCSLAQKDDDSTLNRSLAIYDVREEMYSAASWALLLLLLLPI